MQGKIIIISLCKYMMFNNIVLKNIKNKEQKKGKGKGLKKGEKKRGVMQINNQLVGRKKNVSV